MGTSSKRTAGRLAQLRDALLGRLPARTTGGQQEETRPQDGPAQASAATEHSSGTETETSSGRTASQATAASGTTSSETASPETASSDTGSEPASSAASGDSGTVTDQSDQDTRDRSSGTDQESSEGLQVHEERLSLDRELGVGAVDGAWWPRSDSAADEIGDLLDHLPEDLGRVIRVALNTNDWSEDQPRTVDVQDRSLHLGWFSGMRRYTARVTFESGEAVVLLVLPPSTDEQAAHDVLEAVGEERSRVDLLERAGIELDQDRGDTSEQEDDSGDSETDKSDSTG